MNIMNNMNSMINTAPPKSDLQRLAINEEGFIFDPATGDSFMANESAQIILRCLQQNMNRKQIAEELMQCYDVSDQEVQQDIQDFLSRLNGFGLKAGDHA